MSKFGISADLKSGIKAPFEVSKEHAFNKAYLIEVKTEMKLIENGDDKGKTKPILTFTFSSPDKTKQHVQTYFEVKEGDKAEANQGYFNQKIKHLFEGYAKFPENGIGSDAKNWQEYFQAISDAFNGLVKGKPATETSEATQDTYAPIYTGKLVWLYLTYDNRGRLQIPFPNFIELIVKDKNETKPLTLFVKTKDVIDKPALNASTTAPGVTNTAAAGSEELPDGWN